MSIHVAGRVPVLTLAQRLRIARENASLEQRDLAERVGIARNSVINYERGHTAPRRPVLVAWAMATDVDLGWLETGEGGPALPPDDGTPVTTAYRQSMLLAVAA
jgi:transcriptional regulator with XRE-family HTH domain